MGNMKSSPHVFRATMVPKLAKSGPKGIIFGVRIVPKIAKRGPKWAIV